MSAAAFCSDKDYSVHILRTWRGRQLEAERARSGASGEKAVKLAKVRVAARATMPARLESGVRRAAGVAIEVGRLRVIVERDFDRSTLASVLEVAGHGVRA